VVRGDYPFFLRKEMELRRELGYPPVVELVKVLLEGPRAAAIVEDVLAAMDGVDARVLGPAEIRRPGETVALQLLIKCRDAQEVAHRLRVILESAPKGARVSVDVDPR
jgi:primosomal protein N'